MTCFPSRSAIGRDCRIDECTVDKALAVLIHKGMVQKVSRYYNDGASDTVANLIETV